MLSASSVFGISREQADAFAGTDLHLSGGSFTSSRIGMDVQGIVLDGGLSLRSAALLSAVIVRP